MGTAYLYGHKCTVYRDHEALKFLFTLQANLPIGAGRTSITGIKPTSPVLHEVLAGQLIHPLPRSRLEDRSTIQFPKWKEGNRYTMVFVDYLMKWVFPVPDQTALMIAQLFTEEFVCRHGVPGELLSDRGPAFLSKLMLEVCELMGTKKLNTIAYHPQTDGLVERFNCTLTEMLAKKVVKTGIPSCRTCCSPIKQASSNLHVSLLSFLSTAGILGYNPRTSLM